MADGTDAPKRGRSAERSAIGAETITTVTTWSSREYSCTPIDTTVTFCPDNIH